MRQSPCALALPPPRNLSLIHIYTSLTTEALSEQLKVSKETIRRDLNELQTQGKILRNHGRAKYIHRQNQDSGDPFHIRLKSHYAHKADIAREALAWIEEGMVIALDASSTCWYLARQLPDINIQVFTNSHPICHELGKRERIKLCLLYTSWSGKALPGYAHRQTPGCC